LTHAIKPSAPYFPSQTRFNFTKQTATWTNDVPSFFYSSNTFQTSEHMGTHIDAPYHFSNNSWKVDEIPMKNLVNIHARIIDVSKQCQRTKNYLITVEDVTREELIIPDNDDDGQDFLFVLLFYTGWSKFWPDQEVYAGEQDQLEFPGLSEELANYLVEKYKDKLVGIGIDTLSIDFGPSKNFPVHQILLKQNMYGLENVASLDVVLKHINTQFFTLDVLPMKIEGGTGAPCRILARLNGLRLNETTN